MYKKVWCTCEVVVLLIKPIVFWRSRCRPRRWILKSLMFHYRVFSLTWPGSMQIYWNKRKRLHKKRVQLPQDWFGTPTWPPFHCFGTPIWPPWRHAKTPPVKAPTSCINFGLADYKMNITFTFVLMTKKGTQKLL